MIKKIVNKSINIFSTYCNRVIFGDLKVSYLSKDHSQVEFTPQQVVACIIYVKIRGKYQEFHNVMSYDTSESDSAVPVTPQSH